MIVHTDVVMEIFLFSFISFIHLSHETNQSFETLKKGVIVEKRQKIIVYRKTQGFLYFIVSYRYGMDKH